LVRNACELAGADREDQEVSMLALHLLQSALVHVNTILVQRVLEEPAWASRLTDEDCRGLSPLFWTHVNPYGKFSLDMERHLDLEGASAGLASGSSLAVDTVAE
jgi:Tn3 transposase DDE domain-containing protein